MRVLGIDLGSYSVKAIELDVRFKKHEIIEFHEVILSQDPNETIKDKYKNAIAQIVNRLPSHPEQIAVGLPNSYAALRFLFLPIREPKKVEKMYLFELEDTLPFKIEDSVIEHFLEKIGKEGHLVFAAASPKKLITMHLEFLQTIGLDPDWMPFEGMGIINIYLQHIREERKIKKRDEESPERLPTLLLDIGHSKTNFSVFHEDRIEMSRMISWGGGVLTQSFEINFALSKEQAETVKCTELRLNISDEESTQKEKELMIVATQTLAVFVAELKQSMVSYRTNHNKEIGDVYITGGTSKLSGMREFLATSLEHPVFEFNPLLGVSVKENLHGIPTNRFGEALGSSLLFVRKVPMLFNFRRDELAKVTSLNDISEIFKNKIFIRASQLLIILFCLLIGYSFTVGILSQKELSLLDEEINKLSAQTFPDVNKKILSKLTKNHDELLSYIQKKKREINDKLKGIDTKKTPKLKVILELSEVFPKETKIDVNKLEVVNGQFYCEGVYYSGNLDIVIENIKKNKLFFDANLTKNGNAFTLQGKYHDL